MSKTLSHQQAKKYYDHFGSKQDSQGFYEDKAIELMVKNSLFDQAKNIFEFGCGTGHLAQTLLEKELKSDTKYVCQDISETMVKLTHEKLDKWGERIEIRLSDGSIKLTDNNDSYDRFLSNYVLDLLDDDSIIGTLDEAHRVLKKDGLLCLVSITKGKNIFSKVVMTGWNFLFKIRPVTVGGCRPIKLPTFLKPELWDIVFHTLHSSYGVSSDILVAKAKK